MPRRKKAVPPSQEVQPIVEEKPAEPPIIISKKIEFEGREIYIIRVFLKECKLLNAKPRYCYSAWEIPKNGLEYGNKTYLNDLLLGQLGTEIVPVTDEIQRFKEESIKNAFQCLEIASPGILSKGKKIGTFIIITK